ncbi:MAG: hypothetical protein KTR32_02255 [Granulosicoccus sp.]|nr:hypothetical protein [Granulosicoccus sp.]
MGTLKHCWKAGLICIAFLALSACGGDDEGGVFGTESALSCVERNTVEGGVDITNTCNSNIIVLTDSGERLVIPPNGTNRLVQVGASFLLAACFSPNEPEFDGNEFTCG